ncbi:EamA family transporter [Pseudomonas putida]|uniref:EamA family transporter n=1 Tax=Pseudomonas putida TaxID=303 RepID=UPI000364C14A|nr:EamA family transporter [Pseudomonas putida]
MNIQIKARGTKLEFPPHVLVLLSITSVQIGTAIAILMFHAIPAGGAAFFNAFFSTLMLGVFSLKFRLPRTYSAWTAAFGFGVIISGMFLTFFYAVERIPMAVASTIEFMGPLTLSVIMSRRPIHFIFIGMAIVGIALASPGFESSLDKVGLLFAFLSAVFWAAFIILSPIISRLFEGESGLMAGMAFASLLTLPFLLSQIDIIMISPSVIFAEFLMAAFSTVLPLSLEYFALRSMSARTFGVLVSLEPVAATLIAFLVLSQPLESVMLISILVVTIAAIGISLTDRSK